MYHILAMQQIHTIDEIKPGQGVCVKDMLDPDYRKNKGLSQSELKEFLRSPAHFVAYKNRPREETSALNFGTAFHESMVIHPDDPNQKRYVVKKKVDRRTKEGKEYDARFALENAGAVIIDEEEEVRLIGMRNAVLAHPEAKRLIEAGNWGGEVSMFANFEGQYIKGRLDMFPAGTIVDWKTTDDATYYGFRKSCRKYRYDIQASHYQHLAQMCNMEADRFVFFFVEKEFPYGVSAYVVGPKSLAKANEERISAIRRFRDLSATTEMSDWPCYTQEVIETEIWL